MNLRTLAAAALLVLAVLAWWALDGASDERSTAPVSPPTPRPAAARPNLEALRGGSRTVAPHVALRPLPPPGASLKETLPSLQAQAAEGDAVAACRIAFELDRCMKLPWLVAAANAASREPAGAIAEQRERVAALAAWRTRNAALGESACAGIDQVDPALVWSYAIAAALAGNRQARFVVINGFSAGLDVMRPERTLEEWAEWRQHVARLESDGIADGDLRIVAIAARDYRLPRNGLRIFAEDKVMSVALRMVLAQRAAPEARDEARRGMEYAIRGQGLGAQELAAANARARTLLATLPGRAAWRNDFLPAADGSDCERGE